jgi:pimeloyl-ACP methyl ester carboxylesterase
LRPSQLFTGVPPWFVAALEHQPEHLHVEVDGCRIHMRAWGRRELPPLVLVHGGGAHSGWWDHIAPLFSRTHRVVAPDLSGHGESGTRTSYHLGTWAREVIAASTVTQSWGRPTVVGHSLGGWVTARAAQHYGEHIDSIVVVDSPPRDHAPEEALLSARQQRAVAYRSRAEIIARFTPLPAQETVLPYVKDHIAAESVRRTLKGWSWKFDPAIFSAPLLDEGPSGQETLERVLAEIPCRIGYLRSERGLVSPEVCDHIRSVMQLRGPFVELAAAGHHPMLDQPLPLVATLRTLLEMWSIT